MIPVELRNREQWVIWRLERRNGDRPTKVPYRAGAPHRHASSTDPSTWSAFDAAVAASTDADGIGYVFAAGDPYCGLDFDDCVIDGDLHPSVNELVKLLGGYAETSQSEQGVHVIVRAEWRGSGNATTKTPWGGKFEVYDRSRFFCMTGDALLATARTIDDRQRRVDALVEAFFPRKEDPLPPRPVENGLQDDDDVLDRARRAKNGAAFDALWNGHLNGHDSHSEADLALCGALAFWTGPAPDRIDRLFRRSGLMREKWDERHGEATYGTRTIRTALEGRREFYEPKRHAISRPSRAAVDADVHGGELLDEIAAFIRRFVVLPSDEVGDLLALWVLHTHSFEAAWATPYLRVTSAAPSSGKTLLLEVLAAITRNGWHAINPSVAVLYRKIDRQAPTLLLDEMDNYPLDERRDALAVLNAGYKRGARVDRCKENGDLESFSAFCPKAYAGIDSRALVDTLLSRSITIRLEKRLLSESVEMWIAPITEPEAIPLRERCERWADKHQEALALHRPTLPAGLINREAEVWWALLSIAEFVGGDWPKRARSAAAVLVAGGDSTDGVSEQVQLLADIRDAFGDGLTISTKELTAKLNALDESPWGARRKGEGLDGRGLARLLRPFGIRPRSVRLEDGSTPKGYQWEQFERVFARHLPEAPQAPQAPQPAPHGACDVADVADVADKSPPETWEANPEGERWEGMSR